MLGFGKNSKKSDSTTSDSIKTGSEATFVQDVLEGSKSAPVLVYFTAAWCGPCKSFGPELEKSVRKAGATLVKLDVDSCQRVAAQMGVQSIPAVFAFVDGRPVDGFMGVRAAREIDEFVGRFAAAEGGDLDQEIEAAESLLTCGAAVEAAQRFAAILSQQPDYAASLGGLARAYLATGNIKGAESILDSAPESVADAKEITAAKAAVELAMQAADAGPVAELRQRLGNDPDDHQARLDLAASLLAEGRSADAIDELLELFRRDREWREGAAQAQLIKIFDSLKPNDPVALKGRRKLSSLIFS